MSIQEHLNKIRNAVYGHEVRESIAKGIETAYDDASENGNANMEVKVARGTHPNLRSRLEEVDNKQQQNTAQLAQKVGIGVKAELEDLSPTVLGAIQNKEGETTFNLLSVPQQGSVTPETTTFVKSGKNKFGGRYENVVVLTDGTVRTDPDSMSVVMPIVGGNTYYFRKDSGNRQRLAFHKTKPNLSNTAEPLDYYIGDTVVGTGYTAPVDATYLIYTVSNDLITPPRLQITEGADYPFFIGYDVNLNLESESINEPLLDNSLKTKVNNGEALYQSVKDLLIPVNKFNGVYDSGAITTYFGQSIADFTVLDSGKVAIVKVEKDTTYSVKIFGTANRFKIVGYSNVEKPVPPITGLDLLMGYDTLTDEKYTFNSGTYEWIIVYVSNQNETPEMNFTVGNTIESFIDYDISDLIIGQENLSNDVINSLNSIPTENTYFFLDDISGIYEKPSNLVSVASGQSLVLESSSHTVIYDVYDDLVARFPDYVTKELLGNEATGLPIYQYEFTSPSITNNSSHPYRKLKIAITSAVHGYEQGSAWCLAQFFKDLCDNYSTKEQLEFMRWNVDFAVVPVCNPYGYDHNQRTNSNLVDINRNFDAYWVPTGAPELDGYYGGTSAGSELETQIIQGFINANKDAEYLIDYHNISGGYPLFYLYDGGASTIALNTFKTLTRKWKNDYPASPQDATMFGYINTGVNASISKYALANNVKSFTFETPWKMPFGTAKYDKVTIETGVEALGNTLVTIFKSLK